MAEHQAGPMCSTKCGPGWMDTGTMCLSHSFAPVPSGLEFLSQVGRTRILPVPYFAQPTEVTCQSTCLKMFALYLEKHVLKVTGAAGEREILKIWEEINKDPKRPSKEKNAHANMQWWLEQNFPSLAFTRSTLSGEIAAAETIMDCIDKGYPVLLSVSHARVAGHIILAVGYENYRPNVSSTAFKIVVHDPYGQFHPSLGSPLFGKRRLEGGKSVAGGGQDAPGRNVRLWITNVNRQRRGDWAYGKYILLTVDA